MYTRANYIINNNTDLSNYIEGDDVYNSNLLQYMNDPLIQKKSYIISLFEYRPDLIAKDFYGSEDYESYVILQTGLSISEFKKGKILSLIPKYTLDNLISMMI